MTPGCMLVSNNLRQVVHTHVPLQVRVLQWQSDSSPTSLVQLGFTLKDCKQRLAVHVPIAVSGSPNITGECQLRRINCRWVESGHCRWKWAREKFTLMLSQSNYSTQKLQGCHTNGIFHNHLDSYDPEQWPCSLTAMLVSSQTDNRCDHCLLVSWACKKEARLLHMQGVCIKDDGTARPVIRPTVGRCAGLIMAGAVPSCLPQNEQPSQDRYSITTTGFRILLATESFSNAIVNNYGD